MILPFSALLLAYVLSQFFRAFLAVIAADLSRDLGLGPSGLGDLSAIWFAAFALAQFPVGLALDRIGPRRTMAGLFLVAVLGAGWFAMATGFVDAMVAMALIGIGCSPILMGSMYYFGRTAPPERFALLGSLILGFGSFGNLLGAAPLAYAAAEIGWRASLGVMAAATALSAFAILVLIRDPERLSGKAGGGDGLFAGIAAVFAIPAIRLMVPFVLVSYAAVASLRSLWIAPFFGQVHGFDVSERGHAALLMAAAMSMGALAYGPLEKWFGGAKRTVVIGNAIGVTALAGLAIFGASSSDFALALYAIFGFVGINYAIVLAHGRMFFPPHLLGRGVTTLNFLFIGGAGILQWVSGRMVEWTAVAGWSAASTYGALHGAIAILLGASLLSYLRAPARP